MLRHRGVYEVILNRQKFGGHSKVFQLGQGQAKGDLRK